MFIGNSENAVTGKESALLPKRENYFEVARKRWYTDVLPAEWQSLEFNDKDFQIDVWAILQSTRNSRQKSQKKYTLPQS